MTDESSALYLTLGTKQRTMVSSISDDSNHEVSLETLLSIWPIVSSIAKYTPAGDLISLSRASSTARALTHGFPVDYSPHGQWDENARGFLDLRIGNHQTSHWEHLKSLAHFSCSSPFHKEPKNTGGTNNVTKPCKYCSRPVCKACIVRSFFADPSTSKNTFRYRTRYLCQKCWDGGNLRKDFRYPAESLSREHLWRGRSYGQRGGVCSCSASEDNWLCRGCRSLQQISGPMNASLADADKHSKDMIIKNREIGEQHVIPVQCYGLGCSSVIDDASRDRRRICLWCSKSLPRQFGGEDRLRWEEKQLEIRAAAAAARSADIEEWARNRFKTLTMSRREMRGTEECILLTGRDGPQHDKPTFVRHLDAVNYRQYMGESTAPSPASVYQSKHGRWVYTRAFLKALNRDRDTSSTSREPPQGVVDGPKLFDLTRKGGLRAARRSYETSLLPRQGPRGEVGGLAARLYEAGLMDVKDIDGYSELYWTEIDDLERLRDRLNEQLEEWEEWDAEARKGWQPQTFSELLPGSNAKRRRNEDQFIDRKDTEDADEEHSCSHTRQVQSSQSSEEQARPNEASTTPPIPTYEAAMNERNMTDQPFNDSLER